VDGFHGAVDERAHTAQIRIPAPARQIMRVADPIPEVRALPANVTRLCHSFTLPDWLEDLARMFIIP
jgi:hypothetical protein